MFQFKKKPKLDEMELKKVKLFILEQLQKQDDLEDIERKAVLQMIREIQG